MEVQSVISEKLVEIYNSGDEQISELNIQDGRLNVILLVGVNGVGKTTTIGKLAHKLKQEGKSVVLAAGDTFRAGAIEQLEVWESVREFLSLSRPPVATLRLSSTMLSMPPKQEMPMY